MSKINKGMKFSELKIKEEQLPSAESQTIYANKVQLDKVKDFLSQNLPNGRFEFKKASGPKLISHIRAWKISAAELKSVMSKLGAEPNPPDQTQLVLSGSFPVSSFKLGDVTYSFVISSKRGAAGEESVGLNRKELAPTGLGLAGKKFNKSQLIKATKEAVKSHIRDQELQTALMALVDIAAKGGQGQLPEELSQQISPLIGIISQDFGEILAPLMVMDNNDVAEFPAGNNPIVDVKLRNMNFSIKALTGSGTSFKTVADLMDKYEQSISTNKYKLAKFNILKQFHPSTGGTNVDKLVRAAASAQTPEYNTIAAILNTPAIKDYSDLLEKVKSFTSKMDYGTFLKKFYPAMIAGGWGKPVGLPADGAYYMGQTQKKPAKAKAAGKNSYDAKPGIGAADILTYVMGVSLLNYIRKGSEASEYRDMMTDIVKQADAVIGHITINKDGSMNLMTRPFSDLKFEFQYHAPSHIPGNNLPGFMYVPD